MKKAISMGVLEVADRMLGSIKLSPFTHEEILMVRRHFAEAPVIQEAPPAPPAKGKAKK